MTYTLPAKLFGLALFLAATVVSLPSSLADDKSAIQETDPAAAEIAFWESIKNTKNVLELKAYLDAYPNGKFKSLAMIRLQALRDAEEDAASGRIVPDEPAAVSTPPARHNRTNGIPEAPRALVRQGYLGVELKELPSREPAQGSNKPPVPIRIEAVFSFGPASESGVHVKDIIVSANDRRFTSLRKFVGYVMKLPVESRLDLVILRDGGRKLVSILIGDRLESYWRGAHRDDPVAMAMLGSAYGDGTLIKKDYAKAFDWLKRSAEKDESFGQRALGLLYQHTDWVDHDFAKSLDWLTKSADNGDSHARYLAARLYQYGAKGVPKDPDKAMRGYRKAADKGHSTAMLALGTSYMFGTGVKKDYARAANWMRLAADKNVADAHFYLGYLTGAGQGVTKDDKAAIALYEKAAELGHGQAMTNLGIRYENGNGLQKNLTKAAEWYEKAVAVGNLDALSGLGWMYKLGKGGKKTNIGEALRLFKMAADKGNATGRYNLAILYEEGRGVGKDKSEAIRLYRLAAPGDSRAADRLRQLGQPRYNPLEIQRLLSQLGFDPGKVDGKIGGKSKDAIRAYQRQEGLSVNGKPSLALLGALQKSAKKKN